MPAIEKTIQGPRAGFGPFELAVVQSDRADATWKTAYRDQCNIKSVVTLNPFNLEGSRCIDRRTHPKLGWSLSIAGTSRDCHKSCVSSACWINSHWAHQPAGRPMGPSFRFLATLPVFWPIAPANTS